MDLNFLFNPSNYWWYVIIVSTLMIITYFFIFRVKHIFFPAVSTALGFFQGLLIEQKKNGRYEVYGLKRKRGFSVDEDGNYCQDYEYVMRDVVSGNKVKRRLIVRSCAMTHKSKVDIFIRRQGDLGVLGSDFTPVKVDQTAIQKFIDYEVQAEKSALSFAKGITKYLNPVTMGFGLMLIIGIVILVIMFV